MSRTIGTSAPGVPAAPARIRALARLLLAWYAREKRDLPWRGSRDPYRVWVSEIMLQQTRVATVIPRYRQFLRRFPSIRALARAREREVLAAWSGLGYYSRARNLHAAAREIGSRHGGRFPTADLEIAALPGIGRYTAGAIASIAFDRARPAVDGNVIRVLARLEGLGGEVKSPALRSDVERIAAALVARGRASELNQALMDLGAGICLPGKPDCPSCPVARLCVARRTGRESRIPGPGKRPEPRPARLLLLLLARGRSALSLTAGSGLFRGLVLFPAFTLEKGESPARRALEEIDRRGFAPAGPPVPLGTFRHSVLAHRLTVTAVRAAVRDRARTGAPAAATTWPIPLGNGATARGRFLSIRQIERSPLPSLSRKALDLL